MMSRSSAVDVAIVGGGIVGLATAYALLRSHPRLSLIVLEKERSVGLHQTGHNSGVIHMGLYYRPGSLKARLSVAGAEELIAFCQVHGIPFRQVGKVIVATSVSELPALNELERRGRDNGVPGLRRLDADELLQIEPHAAGIAALHSPHTGIVNYRLVSEMVAAEIRGLGGEIRLNCRVHSVREWGQRAELHTQGGPISARVMVNCAGLYADVLARRVGVRTDVRIVPFRGEYYALRPERRELVRGLIYPVPDPRFPFLGVHFTRTIDGGVEAGPNAVPALAREGYSWGTVNLGEFLATARFSGSRALARRYWRTGAYEIVRSLSKRAFVQSLQRLVPDVRSGDLVAGGAGVRAQAVSADGRLLDDFEIVETDAGVQVLNAPSPAATASFAIGRHIADLTMTKIEG